jgi:beta-glucosidase
MTDLRFPPGFSWGASTAAYQIEGAAEADGRGPSIWDAYLAAGRGHHGETGAVAADHYHRLDADLDLLAALGLTAYRFSIAWPRVMPDGVTVNRKGLDFYRRIVNGLLDRGVTPVPTLYHFDLPQVLEDSGGWADRTTALRFADYAQTVAAELGDLVDTWITVNEASTNAWLGYGHHSLAPGRSDTDAALAACHHQALGHGLATLAVRQTVGRPVRIGPVMGLCPVVPATDAEPDVRAAAMADAHHNRFLLDAILRGHYPAELLDHYAGRPGLRAIRDTDLADIATPVDFLGVNYYRPRRIVAAHTAHAAHRDGLLVGGFAVPERERWMPFEEELGFVEVRPITGFISANGWAVEDQQLRAALPRTALAEGLQRGRQDLRRAVGLGHGRHALQQQDHAQGARLLGRPVGAGVQGQAGPARRRQRRDTDRLALPRRKPR